MTIPTQRVLEALLADPQRERYGLEIGEAAGLRSGTVHPILARLADRGHRRPERGPQPDDCAGEFVRLSHLYST